MIYFIDGSKEAFLTVFLRAFYDENARITSSQCQLTLGQETVFVNADHDVAQRILKRFLQLDKKCIKELDYLLRSGDRQREQIAFDYFMLIAKSGGPIRDMLANPVVLAAEECIRKVFIELDRMRGFVRFIESACGALYAPISPDNDISDLLLPHFCARLPNIPSSSTMYLDTKRQSMTELTAFALPSIKPKLCSLPTKRHGRHYGNAIIGRSIFPHGNV